MNGKRYEHLREIQLDRSGNSVRFVLETSTAQVPEAGEQFCKDVAASLAMYAGRLTPFPTDVRVRFDDVAPATESADAEGHDTGDPPLMEKVEPRFVLDDFICSPEFKHVLSDVVFYARHYPEIRSQMGVRSVTRSFLVNFFGESGTGKTMVAEAFASELGKTLYVMNFANVESSLLGRTPKNIVRAFREIDSEESIIMLDEADAFVSRRIADLRQGAEYALNTARGQIINEMDRFKGMIVLATNLFGTYDNAILRRIKFNLFFELPNRAAIERMYGNFLGDAKGLPDMDFRRLATASEGLSGGDIYNLSEIIVMKALKAQTENKSPLETSAIDQIIAYYRQKTRREGSVHTADSSENAPVKSSK